MSHRPGLVPPQEAKLTEDDLKWLRPAGEESQADKLTRKATENPLVPLGESFYFDIS